MEGTYSAGFMRHFYQAYINLAALIVEQDVLFSECDNVTTQSFGLIITG